MKYLFFDIDGTLVGSNHQVTDETLAALYKAKENGHKLFIATGRAPTTIAKNIWELPMDGFICSAGSYIYINNELISEHAIKEDILQNTISLFESQGIHYTLETKEGLYESKDNAKYFKTVYSIVHMATHPLKRNLELARHLKENKNMVKRRPMKQWDGQPISKIDFISPQNKIYNIEDELTKNFHLVIFGENRYFTNGEIINIHHTKADGIDEVIKHYGGKLEDTIAFGDTMNDYQMLQHAHVSCCYKHSEDALKQMCDYTFDKPEDSGIAKVLKELEII